MGTGSGIGVRVRAGAAATALLMAAASPVAGSIAIAVGCWRSAAASAALTCDQAAAVAGALAAVVACLRLFVLVVACLPGAWAEAMAAASVAESAPAPQPAHRRPALPPAEATLSARVRRVLVAALTVAAVGGLAPAVAQAAPAGGPQAPVAAARVDLGWTVTTGAPTTRAQDRTASPRVSPTARTARTPAIQPAAHPTVRPPASPARRPASPPAASPEASPAAAPTTAPSRAAGVVVAPGDTLWAIARDHLPAEASNADISAHWHAWYAANRDRIGDDPDLLQPGTRLLAPS
ncbi:MAG: LysM domain-containing protein [Kineosporiaceae bacterium]